MTALNEMDPALPAETAGPAGLAPADPTDEIDVGYWPEPARLVASVANSLIDLLNHETDLVLNHRNHEVGTLTPQKQALAAQLASAIPGLLDVDLSSSVRDGLAGLDGKLKTAVEANHAALTEGAASFERILKRAAHIAQQKDPMPIGYGRGGARPAAGTISGPSLLTGLKL